MKNIYAILACLFCLTASAKTNPDDIVGTWLNSSGEGQIQIYKEGDKYFGKIIWLKEPNGPKGNPKLDANNPDKSLQSKPVSKPSTPGQLSASTNTSMQSTLQSGLMCAIRSRMACTFAMPSVLSSA